MPAISVRVRDTQARRRLSGASRRARDYRPVWGDLNANVVQPAMQARFASGGARYGGAWAPLSPAGVRSRLRRGGNRGGVSRPLWDTGRLRAAWVKRGPESVVRIDRLEFERGVVVPYAVHHQEGAGRLPKRKLVTSKLAEHVGSEAANRIGPYVVGD